MSNCLGPHGQSPRPTEFSRQEYWSRLLFPPPGILLTQESNLCLLHLFQWLTDSLPLSHMGNPEVTDQGPERSGGWAIGGGHGGSEEQERTCMAHTPAPQRTWRITARLQPHVKRSAPTWWLSSSRPRVIKSPSVKDQINILSLLATDAFYCIFLFLFFGFFFTTL